MKLYFDEHGKLTGSDARVFAPDGPGHTVEIDPATNPALAGCLLSGNADGMRLAHGTITIRGVVLEPAPPGADFLDALRLPAILKRAERGAMADDDAACVTRISIRRLMEVL